MISIPPSKARQARDANSNIHTLQAPGPVEPKVTFPPVFKNIFAPHRYKVWYGGRGCVHGDTLIDTPDGQVPIKDFRGGLVNTVTHTGELIATYAGPAVKYQKTGLYRTEFSNGTSIVTTDKHRFFTPQGWKTSDTVGEQHQVCVADPQQTSLDTFLLASVEDAPHCSRIVLGYLYRYFEDYCLYDERPLGEEDTYLDVLRRLSDEQLHTHRASMRKGVLGSVNANNHYELFLSHLSSLVSLLYEEVQDYGILENDAEPKISEQFSELFQVLQQSPESIDLDGLVLKCARFFESIHSASWSGRVRSFLEVSFLLEHAVDDGSYSDSFKFNLHYTTATSITQVEDDHYYDIFVPIYNNYLTSGIINHNSGKSMAAAQGLIILAMKEKERILCCREIQRSIQESVIRLISDCIYRMGVQDMFEIQKKSIKCKLNGSEFIFEGLANNVTSIKSLEGVTRVWVEEAEAVTQESWDILIPTIRKENSEIWVTFNPYDEQDPTYQMFVINTPPNTQLLKVNYNDNPYFPEVLRLEMEQMKVNNYKKYLHIWEGEPSVDFEDSIIQPEWVRASIDAHVKLQFGAQGVISTGFDPADRGTDNKATVTRWGPVIIAAHQWKDGDIEGAVDKAFSYAFEYRSDHIVYDSVGVGAAVKMRLDDRIRGKRVVVDPFGGGEMPDEPTAPYREGSKKNRDMFKNKRAQYWWLLRDRFEATYLAVERGIYTNPENLISISSEIGDSIINDLKGELTRVQRKRTRSGSDQIMLESKEDMRKRGVKSPGMADSLAMAFANSLPFNSDFSEQDLVPEAVEYY